MSDYIIIGGGIIGLATAFALRKQNPAAEISVLEKENHWATHQTGQNSGVIHSGIYYKPGSLKAKLAVKGNSAMFQFCSAYGVNYNRCGKVIAATNETELTTMQALYHKGIQNGLAVTNLSREKVLEYEPHVNALGGLHVPDTGIVDYKEVSERLVELLKMQQVDLFTNTEVMQIHETSEEVVVDTNQGEFRADRLINCAGLYSDEIVKRSGIMTDMQIIPFRGDYFHVDESKRHLVKNLIYPVPDPRFPFLGLHLTRMINGEVHAGPNAVLSLKKEGYHKYAFHLREGAAILGYPGFWKLASRNMRTGLVEMARSFNKNLFVKSLQRLVPELSKDDVIPGDAGVRAQALLKDGRLVDDFFIIHGKRSIHVCNAPSPAATASLVIGEVIAESAQ